MKAATHDGECQLCGRKQKLPKDRLSLHGYTKRWGFFNGVCPGARHLPYELSCALLPEREKRVREQVAELRKHAAHARADETVVYVREYVKDGPLRHTTHLVPIKVEEATFGSFDVRFKDSNGNEQKHGHSLYGKSPAEVRAHLNDEYAKGVEGNARQHETYANWLANRIKTWVLKPLRPTEPPKPKAPTKVYERKGLVREGYVAWCNGCGNQINSGETVVTVRPVRRSRNWRYVSRHESCALSFPHTVVR